MARATGTLELAMDTRWLADAARRDPVRHAYARWDLQQAPDQVEFRVWRDGGSPTAYLLIWNGTPGQPVVHWVGDPHAPLIDALPRRPLIAVLPEVQVENVRATRGPITVHHVILMAHDRPAARPRPPIEGIRRLGADDLPALHRFVASEPAWLVRGYGTLRLTTDPTREEPAWAAFDGDRIVGVARAQVRLPEVWVLGGIYVTETHRNRGLGRTLTAAATLEAEARGARAALYVREDNAPARAVYEELGYRALDRRAWVDAGAEREP